MNVDIKPHSKNTFFEKLSYTHSRRNFKQLFSLKMAGIYWSMCQMSDYASVQIAVEANIIFTTAYIVISIIIMEVNYIL